jgi:asparagine synthase (glutamine-hydrolysing)
VTRFVLVRHGESNATVARTIGGYRTCRGLSPLGRKQALRDAALRGLDPAIFDRPKSGFVLPIERWARGGMQAEVAQTLHDAGSCRAAGLAPEAVARLWQAFESGAPGIYWSRVWSVFALLRWCARNSVSLTGAGAATGGL